MVRFPLPGGGDALGPGGGAWRSDGSGVMVLGAAKRWAAGGRRGAPGRVKQVPVGDGLLGRVDRRALGGPVAQPAAAAARPSAAASSATDPGALDRRPVEIPLGETGLNRG